MKVSRYPIGMRNEQPLVKLDNDKLLYPDLWLSASLPEEFVDLAFYYIQVQQEDS